MTEGAAHAEGRRTRPVYALGDGQWDIPVHPDFIYQPV
jgi:hypothetical protein